MKFALKQEALRLGFLLAGVTTPEPPQHVGVFERWVEQGRHGEMDYLSSQRSLLRRADPRQILPQCRSILVLAAPYNPPQAQPHQPGAGKVAAYAWGADYHDLLIPKLQRLVDFLEAKTGQPVPNRYYTDTGPILERDLAQRAGLGWIGKNTLLIHPQHGSYFFLAEILLGIELEPDPPMLTDHCGSCTRCIDACPTACILPDRTLDARRCISYLTIELKGSIPEDLRPQIGDWVFGCDVCQQVCPWNERFSGPGSAVSQMGSENFPPLPQVPQPDLVQELSLSPEAFNRKFKGSPIKRAKRRGYLRNVAVALGNTARSGDDDVVEALKNACNDPEPLISEHARWALSRVKGNRCGDE